MNDEQPIRQPLALGTIKSGDLVKMAMDIFDMDARRKPPLVAFFLGNDFKGGWEGWLQAEYARLVETVADVQIFDREVTYPHTALKCDLYFQSRSGAALWVELKTQRRKSLNTAVANFQADVDKIKGLPAGFLGTNVTVAICALVVSAADVTALDAYRSKRPAGTLRYYAFAGSWKEVTDVIKTVPVGTFVVASWVPTTL